MMKTEEEILGLFNPLEIGKWYSEVEKNVEKWKKELPSHDLTKKFAEAQIELSSLKKKLIKPGVISGTQSELDLLAQTIISYNLLKEAVLELPKSPRKEHATTDENNNNQRKIAVIKFNLLDSELEEIREKTRESIFDMCKLNNSQVIKNILKAKKRDFSRHVSHLLPKNKNTTVPKEPAIFNEQLKTNLNQYYELKFAIDALEQYLYKEVMSIEDQEQARTQTFRQCETPESILDLIKALQKIKIDDPSTRKLRDLYSDYLVYKYLMEFIEIQLEAIATLPLHDRLCHIQTAITSTEIDLISKIQMLRETLAENFERDYTYKLGPNFFHESDEQLNEILSIYRTHHYQKTLKPEKIEAILQKYLDSPLKKTQTADDLHANSENDNNNAASIPQGKNLNGFHHHSQHELAQINLQKEAHELFEKGVRLNQQLANMSEDDPTAQKIYNEAREALTNAVAKGSADAERYLQNMFCSTIMRFGF